YHHALRNAILPVVTVIGIEAAFLMGGLIVTETVFNIPGVARYLVTALTQRDYPIVQNLVMFIAIIVVLINFLVAMLYAVLDPRIKYSEGGAWRPSIPPRTSRAPAPMRPDGLGGCAISPAATRSALPARSSWWCSCSRQRSRTCSPPTIRSRPTPRNR